MSSPVTIDVTSVDTWPIELIDTIAVISATTEPAEDVEDLAISPEGAHAIWATLIARHLTCRHFTRLLPHEIDSIRNTGLRMHSRAHFNERLESACAHGYFDNATTQELKNSTIPAAEPKGRGDRQFVCLTVGPILEQDPRRLGDLVVKWGGEGIYRAAGSPRHSAALKRVSEQSRRAAVHVSLPIPSSPASMQAWPPLENLFLGQFRKMDNIFGDVHFRYPIPADAIDRIELL